MPIVQEANGKHFVYLPQNLVRSLNIHKGNVIQIQVTNSNPDHIEEPKRGLNFKKGKKQIKLELEDGDI